MNGEAELRKVSIRVDAELVDKLKENAPELKGLSYSRVVDYVLRKELERRKEYA